MIVKGDSEFSAFARNLQDDWRVKNDFPIGTYKNPKGEMIELGNYIEKKYAFEKGANFLIPKIRGVVATTLANKEKGAKIEKNRLYTNLLSSQPLAFNLFAELSLDNKLATKFFCEQFPGRIKEVTKIIFEHSDGRRNCEYTCDDSAFDVFVEFKPISGKNGFIGIEVKYAESLSDAPSSHKSRYENLTNASGLFKQDSISSLKQKPIQQIWRDHLLSISHLHHKNKKYDDGFFVYLSPKNNDACKDGVRKYIENFISFDGTTKKHDEKTTGFYPRHLEDFMFLLRQLDQAEWTEKLLLRYFGDTILYRQ